MLDCHHCCRSPGSWCFGSFLAAALLVLVLSGGQAAARESLVFTPLPLTNPQSVIAGSRNLVEYMAENLGRDIHIHYEPDYAGILEKFQAGRIDLVHLGPLPYVFLRAMNPQAEPLVFFRESDGAAAYTCALAAALDGPGDLTTARGPVGLTQPLSTCGFLVTAYLLRQGGLDLHALPYAFLGSHEAVALSLARGTSQTGGLKTMIGQDFDQLGVRILARSPLLPGFALVANGKTLSGELLDRLAALLIQAPANVYEQWIGLGRWGMSPARLEDYCGLLEMARAISIPECGGLDCSQLTSTLEQTCLSND
jgi:phosphonate transport system substrate-binding protein